MAAACLRSSPGGKADDCLVTFRVVFTPEAEAHLYELYTYIAEAANVRLRRRRGGHRPHRRLALLNSRDPSRAVHHVAHEAGVRVPERVVQRLSQ